MWRLPKLEWNGCAWSFALSRSASAQLAAALLVNPGERIEHVTDVLRRSPGLTLWLICRNEKWHTRAPESLEGVAQFFIDDLLPTGCLRLATESDASEASHELQRHPPDPRQLLSAAGPDPAALFTRACPWCPTWLESEFGNLFCASDDLQGPSSDAMDGAELLPAVLQAVRRELDWERNFADRLEHEKLAAMRELAYGASHEINNPLANIATRAQALLRDEKDGERRRRLATIAAQAFRAHEMIADMMLFAKPPRLQREDVELGTLVREVLGEMQADADAQGTSLVETPPTEPLVVPLDRTQLGVALKALVRNAVEAIGSGGTVAVSTCRSADNGNSFVEISVRDSGPGITPEVRRHLFDPFYSGREAGRGLGFGLAKTWRICELHGGRIDVTSEVGFGSTFTMRLPTVDSSRSA